MITDTLTGTSNRTMTERTYEVSAANAQHHRCCGQTWARWDADDPPWQWDLQDGEPIERISQCGTCGGLKASKFTSRRLWD